MEASDADIEFVDGTFRVAGTTRFYLAGGMAFFIDRQVAERKFGLIGADGLLIDAKPDQPVDVAALGSPLSEYE